MQSRLSNSLVLTILAIAVSTVALFAQGTSLLRGRVTDPQAAVVSGATVTVTVEATGAKRTTTSDAEGGFAVAELPPGLISVEVAATGFASQLFEHVTVAVGQTRDLDVSLAVAGVREVITIDESDSSEPVDTVTSSVDAVIGQREIASLPLNGRNFLELALLVPGNAPAPNFDPTKTNSVLISSAGQLGRGGNITIDGADNNDDVVGGPLQNLPQDAVQEFQIATNRVLRRDRTLGIVRDQRRHAVGTSELQRRRAACSSATIRCRACRRPSTARIRIRPSIASSTRSRLVVR